QQFRRALDEHERLLLIPGVIAAGDDVGAGVDDLVIDHLGNAEAAGGVLAVDRDEVELPVPPQRREPLEHDLAPAAADDIADEEDAHGLLEPRGIENVRRHPESPWCVRWRFSRLAGTTR